MSRNIGAKNHPKTFHAKLSEINSLFKDDAVIKIDICYAPLFGAVAQTPILEEKKEEKQESVDFQVRDLNIKK